MADNKTAKSDLNVETTLAIASGHKAAPYRYEPDFLIERQRIATVLAQPFRRHHLSESPVLALRVTMRALLVNLKELMARLAQEAHLPRTRDQYERDQRQIMTLARVLLIYGKEITERLAGRSAQSNVWEAAG